MPDERAFQKLIEFLARIPAVLGKSIDSGFLESGCWWVQFRIDVEHRLAWNAVQELSQVLNYLSIHERLPTVFKPVSPPVYLNGGPKYFLSWVIESTNKDFEPGTCAGCLEERLPAPVEDETQWNPDEE